jgi:hypothetical protein
VSRPLLLDLFCGGGGAAMGYHRAGFDVVGADLVRIHEYPFELIVGDAIELYRRGDVPFVALHASPPCKLFTTAGAVSRSQPRLFEPHRDLLTPLLELLAKERRPWVVENVPGSPMPAGSVQLCGSSFGLDLRRHRLFASNVPLTAPPCDHAWQTPRFPSLENDARKAGRLASVVGVHDASDPSRLHGAHRRATARGTDMTEPYDDDLGNVTASPEDVAYECGWHDGVDYGYRLAERELRCPKCDAQLKVVDQ